MAEDLNMNSNDVRDQNVTEEANTIETVKAIQPRSLKRRIERQYELIVKRAKNWYEDGSSTPNFAMFYLQRGEIVTEGPPHMAAFLKDPVVLKKFKEVALERTVSFHTASETAAEPEPEPFEMPYSNPNLYTWDVAVFLLPVLLAREGIKGKHAYRESNRPSWWPEHVRFCSPNSSTTDSKRLNVTELRVVIGSYLQNCKHMYTLYVLSIKLHCSC